MVLSKSELHFLIFFLPLFFAKLIDLTATDAELVAIAAFSFAFFIIKVLHENFSRKELITWVFLGAFATLLMFVCGKEGFLFSIIMMISIRNVDLTKIYKICFFFGIFGVLLSMYIAREGMYVPRYNGTWQSVYKRSNILYISYMAIVSLFCLCKKNKFKFIHGILILIISVGMYKYSGSRTGIIVTLLLLIFILALSSKPIRKSKIVKWVCSIFPIICCGINYFICCEYRKFDFLYILDRLMQGRLDMGKHFLDIYNVKLFGQKIFESTNANNYMVLDAAYLDMLLCYGLLFLILWLITTCIVIQYLYKQDRYVEIAVIMMYSVYGISETFLPNCFLNVSIFLYGEFAYSVFRKEKITQREIKNGEENKDYCNVSATIS